MTLTSVCSGECDRPAFECYQFYNLSRSKIKTNCLQHMFIANSVNCLQKCVNLNDKLVIFQGQDHITYVKYIVTMYADHVYEASSQCL